MKMFLLSALATVILAAAAALVLDTRFQESSEARFTTSGVRLDPSI